LNYKILKGKINLNKNDIGYFSFVENKKNGILRIITKLPEIEKTEFNKFYVELDNKKIDFNEFRSIKLKDIIKKISLPSEKLKEKKYNNYEKVILLFTE
jgi:Fe-S cluster assembly ATPase SufC